MTLNGWFWQSEPVAAQMSPIAFSRSRLTPSRFKSANVTGRPTAISKSTIA